MTGADFAALLERGGFDFFTGVPCSLIEDLVAALERHPRLPYVAAVREDAAVGVAGGAWLAGRRPAILMQNSGLGTCLNALASFSLMYGLPALLLVTWRGQGPDAPEHVLMGAISPGLLALLGIPHRVLAPASVEADLAWAADEMARAQRPVALLVPPGLLPVGHGTPATAGAPVAAPPVADAAPRPLVPSLSRLAALTAAVGALGDEPVVHANGYICRESCAIADRPQNFYMIGSMGLASSIALGLALGRPRRTAVVFDGDGNLLMNLGMLATIGGLKPPNLVHCVFDNEVYGSTGNQRSPSREVRLDRLAAAAGYARVAAVTEADEIAATLAAMLASDGPHFLLVKVTAAGAGAPRIPHTPAEIRDRFRRSLGRAA